MVSIYKLVTMVFQQRFAEEAISKSLKKKFPRELLKLT